MSDHSSLASPDTRSAVSPGPGATPSASAVLFVRMWAIAHLIHLASANGSRLDTPWNITVVVAALVLLLRPTSGTWFVVLAVAQLADLVAEMPYSPDHWMLMAFANLTILVTMVFRRSVALPTIASAFPALRLLVLVCYSAAALAKYNANFLDPVTSCATAIAGAASLGVTTELGIGPFWVFSVLACETSIPLLLAFPRTRRHGVRLALAFHFMLSASPAFAVVDFTATLFALFMLFLADAEIDRVLDRVRRMGARSAVVRDARRKPWVTAALALVVIGFLGYVSGRASGALVLLGSEVYLLALLVAVLLTWRSGSERRAFGRLAWFQVPVIVLALLWAASPYLGSRTTAVFTMFSGIRTEGTAPNHLFLPTVHLTDWQDDFVVIETSNDPALASAEDGRAGVPLLALRELATDNPDLVVVGTLHGERVTFGSGDGQRHLEPVTGWQAKFLHFRPVAVSDRAFCSVS
ncbi:MAG: hypothetical protein ABWX84_09940 [Nocardioides sp.]